MMTEKDFLGHGALNLDIIYEIDSLETLKKEGFHLKPGHETTGSYEEADLLLRLLNAKGRLVAKSGGGSSANTISALARLGFKTGFLGSVGDDDDGGFILASMTGVDTSRITRLGRSAVCLVVLERTNRNRAMLVAPHNSYIPLSNAELTTYLRETQCVHLSSVVTKEGLEGQVELVKTLLTQQLLSFDPGEIYASIGLTGGHLNKALVNLIERTDILFVTEAEIRLLTGKTGKEAVSILLPMLNPDFTPKRHRFFAETDGPAIVMKKGADGASLYSRRIYLSVPAESLDFEIVDNTGAGDAFNAGVLAAIFKGKDAVSCLRTGTMLAAHSLSAFGRAWMDELDGFTI
ncbi:MAG: carbohydrate kinase family protein [Dissulfurimicrobium sp.]|uniref:carbohydrate kinase family protein n=1 Tax=Dissulfurimicrobium sp. TaxID=2022436 RepID=UPI00404A1BBB